MKVVVIGAGFGGLAAAIRLQAAGHRVTIVEKLDQPGGRAIVHQRNGFTFDAGPTIITAPRLLDEIFHLAGSRLNDFVTLVPIDPFYRVRFPDGTAVDWGQDEAGRLEQVRRMSPDDESGYRHFAELSRRIFEAAFPLIDRSFDDPRTMIRAVPQLIRARAWRSVGALVEDHVRDDRLRQLLSFHPLLIGGNPFASPSIYALIHELERRWGVWFVQGGTGALVAALARLFTGIGGTLRLGSEVQSIDVDPRARAACGVTLRDGEAITADTVISNADPVHTYVSLISPRYRARNADARMQRFRQSMSLFVLYFGTDRQYDDVAHHEIILGPRYRGLLNDVFHHRRLADDFSIYLHRPTATDPSLAPSGCDTFYALSPVPNLGGNVDWSSEGPAYRDRLVHHLETCLLPNLRRHIVTEFQVDPRWFRDGLNSHLGSAFSVEPTLTQSAWFRPHVQSEDLANLYLVGAGTHPGAGIPGVLSSAKIVAGLIGDAEPSSRPGRAGTKASVPGA